MLPGLSSVLQGGGKLVQHCPLSSSTLAPPATALPRLLCHPSSIPSQLIPVRYANFFNKHTSQELWKGVVSVSKHGARKGRNKGMARRIAKDLNKGQAIGVGSQNMVWPGLNAPVFRGNEVVRQQLLEPNHDRQRRLLELRDNMQQLRRRAIHPLERGWSGPKLGGRKLGPPDPVGNETFEGFETICLEFKVVSHYEGHLGRVRSPSVICVTGNGNGLAGFALAKSTTAVQALKVARNRAGQLLWYLPRFNDHTVLHDFQCQFGTTILFVSKRPPGFGLVCHRAVKAICEVVGIKDLYAKLEGSNNVRHIIKAFFLGLKQQKTPQQLAEEKGMHVVEIRHENYGYPTVLASPQKRPVRTLSEIDPNENLDYNIHVMGDRVMLPRNKSVPWYVHVDPLGWEKHLKRNMVHMNKLKARNDLIKMYGVQRSFLYDQYPECIGDFFSQKQLKKEEDDD